MTGGGTSSEAAGAITVKAERTVFLLRIESPVSQSQCWFQKFLDRGTHDIGGQCTTRCPGRVKRKSPTNFELTFPDIPLFSGGQHRWRCGSKLKLAVARIMWVSLFAVWRDKSYVSDKNYRTLISKLFEK